MLPDPADIRDRRRHSREECIQELLAALVVAGNPPRWNTPAIPTDRGLQLLTTMAGRTLSPRVTGPVHGLRFFNEFGLPRRHDAEAAGWPDFAVLAPDRLTLIELKTEPSSHRPGQLAHYADLATHHYPQHELDLVYLTPPLRAAARLDPVPHRHLGWEVVAQGLRSVWDRTAPPDETATATAVLELLDDLHLPWQPSAATPGRTAAAPRIPARVDVPSAVTDSTFAALTALADQVAADGTQRAADIDWRDPEQMELARLELRDACVRTGLRVQPWIWRGTTSGGRPRTDSGQRLGYELRISRRS